MAEQLTLPQALALLLVRPDGKVGLTEQGITVGLGGAVVGELALRGLLTYEHPHVIARKAPLTGDPLLDGPFTEIVATPKSRRAGFWVGRFGKNALRIAVLEGLAERGILDREERRALGIFRSTVYPERDGGPEKALRAGIADVLEGRLLPTPFTAALIGLLDATGTLRKQFGKVDRAIVRRITEGDWVAPAVKSVLAAQAAATGGAGAV
ncbi:MULTISPECIES: GPP34 family phosphoprotein [unclassified Curtobacterium]|uniref:GOLPH3/VPS74 family protein n=1 Tax=unclassified Curtobacterium TaxID=257496 RepID=UPI0015E8EA78|nr:MULTISPECIES: GPP34 family phosphoprotein [unclassified Curtobacterium]WIB36964.1 GPP34 family phosphoprotein [Curtobacterium sp. MCJR17_043]